MGLYYKGDEILKQKINNNKIISLEEHAVMPINSEKHGNFEVLIDLMDVEKIQEMRWCINRFKPKPNNTNYKYYVVGSGGILLHRFILDAKKGLVVDHINHNTCDNRKHNLRQCTISENRKNNNLYESNKSGHVGVIWYPYKNVNKWMAYICVNEKRTTIGYYDTYEEACKRREEAEIKHYSDFSNLNERVYV